MKTRTIVLAMLLTATGTAINAQDMKRPFTLDDLIPGGSTYYQSSVPENKYYAWWGEQLVQLDIDRCTHLSTLNDKRSTSSPSQLFTLDDINQALMAAELPTVRHLLQAEFPYPDKNCVLITLPRHRALVDWVQKKVVWSQRTTDDDLLCSHEDWNPTSRCLASVVDHNLYVTDADGHKRAVSTDGSLDITYGESVHRDEFGITKGTFWSEDGRKLAFYRMDQSMVSTYPQVDISPDGTSRCAKLVPDKYPMAGETSHKVSVGIFDTETGKTTYLDTGDPTDRYFTNIAWAPDGKTLYLIELNRDQNHATLDSYDVATGRKTATLLEEHNDKYVEPLQPIRFLPWDNTRFIYQTRNRSGDNHLYLCRLTKSGCNVERQLTSGTWEVIDMLGFNKDGHTVIYTSNEANTIGQAIYSVDMRGKRKLLSTSDGWHNASLSPEGTALCDNWSSPTVARQIDLITFNDERLTFNGKKDTSLNVNRSTLNVSPDPWDQFLVPEMQVGTIKAADGATDLYYRLVLPTDFDPTKKYPAIVYVYGGPHAHNIDASRHNGVRGWDIWMAQQGYVMFCLDNRGSEHRGLEFEQATFRRLGVEEMKDQICGIDYLKSLPYVDADRIGVHGWSFGGFMTTSLMTTYPDVFKVGVAGGPVIDWKYYEVMYGERYMDTPQTNPEGYEATSLINKADRLKGRLLIIYGGNDPTCVPQHTLSFIRACIDAGTHPDLFTYPGDGHNMMGTDRVHLHEHITRYFNDHLK